eukprot:scaffold1442_cov128-Cylindrotheca_fusiformis.AAC.35
MQLSEPSKDFIAGTMGGFAGKLLDFPFDTIKVLLQTQGEKPRYTGAWHCFQSTVENHGVAFLYKGISSPLLGSMAENALLFWAYSHCKKALGETEGGEELSLFRLALAGAGAGALAPFVNTPVELVKCRLQVQNSTGVATAAIPGASGSSSQRFRLYKGPIDVVVQTVKTEGLVGLYRGNVSTLAREVPGNFVWYGVYEGVCKFMTPEGGTKADLGPSVHLLGGALSGVGYWTAFYPADTVKSMIQTNPDHMGNGFVETMVRVYQREGIRGLYRGWGITAARAAPSHAMIFAIYEYTMKLLKPTPDHDPKDRFAMYESVRD